MHDKIRTHAASLFLNSLLNCFSSFSFASSLGSHRLISSSMVSMVRPSGISTRAFFLRIPSRRRCCGNWLNDWRVIASRFGVFLVSDDEDADSQPFSDCGEVMEGAKVKCSPPVTAGGGMAGGCWGSSVFNSNCAPMSSERVSCDLVSILMGCQGAG